MTFVLNNENLQGLQLVNSNCRGLHFASKTNVQVIATELEAFISTNVMSISANPQLKMNQELLFDGNAGYEWAQNNGFYEATNRLVRAASVVSRIKRLVISTQGLTQIPRGLSMTLDDAKQQMKLLCDRYNIMFRIPGLEPLDPFNMNQQCSFSTLALARMVAAIDHDFTQYVTAAHRSSYVQKCEDSGYNTAIVFNSMTTNTIMQCLNTIIEALIRRDKQYDLITEYLNMNMKCSEGRQGDGCGPDFDYRSQDYEKDEYRVLL
ncbi:MAG: hypothetical protein EZS28_010729 [Streblomastix strix]|uniref:Uncharacterized protein n=1 Tax=Streblomastix strix TaxID=222440 RepID=A0A5J4WHG9_9EUKA|nr:MAG: hypothetical protein EZS28_010729 [Streblomastix strix]